MTIDRLINILVTVTLIEMMVALGLSVTIAELLAVIRDGRLILRAVLANYLCVPAATVALLLLFDATPMVAAGFLIMAVCPGAPYGPPLSALAKGNVPMAVGLMVLLAGSSAIVAPLLLQTLMRVVSGASSGPIDIQAGEIVLTLLVTQLLPLCGGVAVRHWFASVAKRLTRPANLLSKLLNLVGIGMILLTQFEGLVQIRPVGFLGMLLLLAASWATGGALAARGTANRKTMLLTTGMRNIGVALVVATGAFSGTPAVTAVAAFGLVSLFSSLALAAFLGNT